jgi:hypothetical protein
MHVICGLDPALLHSGGSIGLEFQVYNFLNKRVFFFFVQMMASETRVHLRKQTQIIFGLI